MSRAPSMLDRFQQAIHASGIFKAELARRLGIKPQQFYQIFRGKFGKSKHIPKIAEALKVDVEWLMTGADSVAPAWCAETPKTPFSDLEAQQRQRRFRVALAMRDMTQIEVARMMGTSDAYLGVVIKRGSPVLTMETVAAHIGVSAEWLMSGSPAHHCATCGQEVAP